MAAASAGIAYARISINVSSSVGSFGLFGYLIVRDGSGLIVNIRSILNSVDQSIAHNAQRKIARRALNNARAHRTLPHRTHHARITCRAGARA